MEKRKLIPATDIYETKESYVLLMEMPGIDKSTLSVKVDDDRLVIDASTVEVGKEWRAIDTEFELGEYHREFRIGNKVNKDKIEASYQDGILTLTLHKAEDFKPRQIEVKTA
ncbi:MAG: Hsp20/alpha crystallin family protein [Brevinematales bacterium]|nr:Hsp20/alpha crystallin family protein [Brevinematales bacterium]